MSAFRPLVRQRADAAAVLRSSELLLAIAADRHDPRITIGEIVDGLRDRAYGLVFVLLALPNIVPAPPGLGGAFGGIMAVFAGQLLFGSIEPRLPGFVRRW
ncbi:MAG TPA: exopolysaccharide biosynthesis protein, partial [Kiloniellaceae bacterium]